MLRGIAGYGVAITHYLFFVEKRVDFEYYSFIFVEIFFVLSGFLIFKFVNKCLLAAFKKGDNIKVLTGPFADIIATVEKYEANHRIWILMDLMGRETKIEAPSDALKLSD